MSLPLLAAPKAGTLRIVAPSGPFPRERFDRGLAVLCDQGYAPHFDEGLFAQEGYLAGSDARRLAELEAALLDPEVSLVWAARGGYGAMRLLPHLERALQGLRAQPKLLVGFSDLTALHTLLAREGVPSLHAPVVCGLGELQDGDRRALFSLLAGEAPTPYALEGPPITPGQASGRLLGGNLSVLTRLLGTPYMPDLNGTLLLLEDVGERPYRLDRMLTHLELAGVPSQIVGVVVGDLTGCEGPEGSRTALQVVTEQVAAWGLPAHAGLRVGHGSRNLPLPLGVQATLDADQGTLSFDSPLPARPR